MFVYKDLEGMSDEQIKAYFKKKRLSTEMHAASTRIELLGKPGEALNPQEKEIFKENLKYYLKVKKLYNECGIEEEKNPSTCARTRM